MERARMMKKIALCVVLSVLMVTKNYAQSDAGLKDVASAFFTKFVSNDDAAYNYLDQTVKNQLPLPALKNLLQYAILKNGAFNSISDIVIGQTAGYNSAIIKASFVKNTLEMNLTFNKDNKIIGLSNLNVAYSDPTYADKSLYVEQPITVETGSFKLPGTLTLPVHKTNFPVVVLVHGSGPNDRDESLMKVKTFRDLALGLAVKGIASIRYDKRTKVYGLKSALPGQQLTINEETIDDAVSAIQLAATIEGADQKKIFLIGHSLGAMLAPQIANRAPRLAGLITIGNPARKFATILAEQYRYLFSLEPQSEANTKKLDAALLQIEAVKHADTVKNKGKYIMGATAYYWSALNAYDQVKTAAGIKLPFLIMQGARDYNVPMEDFNIWKEKLKEKTNVVFKLYPKLNHMFTEGEGKLSTPAEYQTAANVPIYVINDIAAFIFKN